MLADLAISMVKGCCAGVVPGDPGLFFITQLAMGTVNTTINANESPKSLSNA